VSLAQQSAIKGWSF